MVEAVGELQSSSSGSGSPKEGDEQTGSSYFYMPTTDEQVRNIILQLGYELHGTYREQKAFLEDMLDAAEGDRYIEIVDLIKAENLRAGHRDYAGVYSIGSQEEGPGGAEIESVERDKSLMIRVRHRNSEPNCVLVDSSMQRQALEAAQSKDHSAINMQINELSFDSQHQQKSIKHQFCGQKQHPANADIQEEVKQEEDPVEEVKQPEPAIELVINEGSSSSSCAEEEMKAPKQSDSDSESFSENSFDPADMEETLNAAVDYVGVHDKGATQGNNLFLKAKLPGHKISFDFTSTREQNQKEF